MRFTERRTHWRKSCGYMSLFTMALVTREVVGPDGKIHKEIDEDKKIQVQMHLLEVIQTKWRELI